MEHIDDSSNVTARIRELFLPYKTQVKRSANGLLKHDYLVPAGPYQEQWDWDGFFIGMSLLMDDPTEARYLRNWALNYLDFMDVETGFTPGLVTPHGRDTRLHHIKPFFSQGIYFASQHLGDFVWIAEHFEHIKKSVLHRREYLWNAKYDLGVWYDGMESGADNNVALLSYPNKTIIGADLNAWLYREYIAMSIIAEQLGNNEDAVWFAKEAVSLKNRVNELLWSEEDESYYNFDTQTGKFIRRTVYSNVMPLFAGMASQDRGQRMCRRYVLAPEKLWANAGLRTLAADDPEYNNVNMIKPHSNWQGPVWPIANVLMIYALLHYGFQKEAREVAEKISQLCIRDIERTGGMHECYDAETGEPLAAPNFISWNLLVAHALPHVTKNHNPFQL